MRDADSTIGFSQTYVSDGPTLPATEPVKQATIDPRRYVIRKELARGGMGRVSIADDVILGRTVAIKELLDPGGDMAARFRRELALTARLQHPAIVSIHDGGVWTTGELAYVMRLVSGDSLDKVLDAQDTLAARIALLPNAIAMVDALAYAHAQGIIHRDLKPANVLVGDFGETVVIDWGLAKDLAAPEPSQPGPRQPFRGDTSNAKTIVGSVIGTPAYMAPEQAAGEAVDARADVYSLGAVLYHLLSGVSPHDGKSLEAVMVLVLEGNVKPLAERVPDVPKDLQTIVAKAMALRPADRYANAGELAADLKAYQAGQLVGAHHYTTAQLVRRWLRKHRTAVTITTIAAVLVAVLGVMSVSQIVKAQGRSQEAEAIAEANRRDAEDLIDFMLVDLKKGLEPVGKVDLLFGVASRARDYYDRKPIADHHAVLARENLAAVLDAQGNAQPALAENVAALGLAHTLELVDPTNVLWQHDLAKAHLELGYAYDGLGKLPAARAQFEASVATARTWLIKSTDAAWQRDLEAAELGLGHVLLLQDDVASALAAYRLALELAISRHGAHPDDPEAERGVMVAHNRVGDALAERGDHAAALVEYRAAFATAERLAKTGASDATRDLSIAHGKVGVALKKLKDRGAAVIELRAAVELDQGLVRHDPANAVWQRDLVISENRLSKMLLENKDYAGALAGYRETLAIRVRAAEADPTNAERQHDLAMNHYFVGDALEDSGDAAGALAEYKQAVAIVEKVVAHDPTNARWQVQLRELTETVRDCCKH